ncbi:MAG: polyprenyl diphosphate synthase [bacterium]|nr:polyprenyl diphosphate synthase [bacterium]
MEDNTPKHVAIIMDGNRRWARARGLEDFEGHKAGSENLEKIVEEAVKLGIKTLTVYALSTENLHERAKREITAILGLIASGFKTKFKKLAKNGVRLTILGDVNGLPKNIQKIIRSLADLYIEKESIRVNIALNYGGRNEMVTAIKNLIKDGIKIDELNEKVVHDHLYTAGQSDPDLVIRTGGHFRVSNFLLWQTAYSEFYFSKKLWPDFSGKDLKTAVTWFKNQKRNFGK